MASAALIAGLTLGVPAASASTPGCTSGTYYGYCGTQADNGSPVLVIDNSRQIGALNNPVIGWTDSASDPATDWLQLAYAGNSSLGVMFIWAPGGMPTDWCMADPGNGRVVLRGCNGGSWQRWIASTVAISPGYYTWANRATHRILQANGHGGQLTTGTAPAAVPTGSQQWKFSD